MSKTKIGCLPNSIDFNHPQDRRRYIPYFKAKNLDFEIAIYDNYYEILYVSLVADLNKWCNYKKEQLAKKKKARVIFDLSDFYLVGNFFTDSLRPIYHYLSGRTSSLKFSYKETIFNMILNTDVLICGSQEQKLILDKYHKNVIVVRDYFFDDIYITKNNYQLKRTNEINILWEGLSHGNIEIFKMLKEILCDLNDIHVKLHIVTDSEYCRIGSSHFCQPTYNILKSVFSGTNISFHLYDWNPVTFASIAISCDMALIPIPDDPFMQQKPENKLILLWSLGIPVITTNTKSYQRVMQAVNENYFCATNQEWREKIMTLASSQSNREKYMKSVSQYLEKYCSAESIFSTYDKVFFSNLS